MKDMENLITPGHELLDGSITKVDLEPNHDVIKEWLKYNQECATLNETIEGSMDEETSWS